MKIDFKNVRFFDQLFDSVYALKKTERLQTISQHFLTKTYLSGALGEGVNGEINQAPFCRFDAFDCVTYVNTVLALYYANSWVEFQHHLSHLNYYSGNVRYENRFHFMSVDWNPQNIRNSYVQDITESFNCDYATTHIDKVNWFKQQALNAKGKLRKKMHALSQLSKITKQYVCTPYIPIDAVQSIVHQFPPVLIVEIVRPNWRLADKIGTNLNISHVGFLLLLNNEYVFRHASQHLKSVVDQPFFAYLEKCKQSSTIKGINLQQLCDPVSTQ